MIPLIPEIFRVGRVAVPHTNDAHYVVDRMGQRWVAKREADMGCEALLAEAVTWLLAKRVGVPVPDAAFCDDPNERAWLSSWLANAKHWSCSTVGQIRNPAAAASILALDAVVFNEARHAGNILVVPNSDASSTIVAIDADEALIGHPNELAGRGLLPPEPRILAPGFPPQDWSALALTAAIGFEQVPTAELLALVQQACTVAREPNVQGVFAVLSHRCRHAKVLTQLYLTELEHRP